MVNTDNDWNILEHTGELERGSLDSFGHKYHSTHPLNFSSISSIKALNKAWQKFSRGKKSRVDVAQYQKDVQSHITELHRLLESGHYTHDHYQRFMIHDPKQRIIHKASVQDRLVHQAVVTAIEPLFEKRFIYDTYSCRPGKGTHAGVIRARQFLQKESRNNTRKVYALKCDVRKYFASIDHEILMQLLERYIHDEQILELLRAIILSHGAEIGKGIPLGNVTSQLFANVYLHELDWYMKQQLSVKYYLRYCDDFMIISTDKAYLQSLVEPIRDFLRMQLGLHLHPHKVTIRSWNQGIDFLGSVLRPHITTLRTKTRRRMIARVTSKNLNSYPGMCSHGDSYHLSQVLRLIAWQRHSNNLLQ